MAIHQKKKETHALRGTFVADYEREILGAVTPTPILCDQIKKSTLIWDHKSLKASKCQLVNVDTCLMNISINDH